MTFKVGQRVFVPRSVGGDRKEFWATITVVGDVLVGVDADDTGRFYAVYKDVLCSYTPKYKISQTRRVRP